MESSSRFASVSENEMEKLLRDRNSENTKKSTKLAVAIIKGYLLEKGDSTDFVSISAHEINDLLKKFYLEARKKDGADYCKSSLTSIRFGLCRHIKSIRPDIDIIKDDEFREANCIFKAKSVELKKKGKARVEHKPP